MSSLSRVGFVGIICGAFVLGYAIAKYQDNVIIGNYAGECLRLRNQLNPPGPPYHARCFFLEGMEKDKENR